jgi:hypothetical protein
VVVKDDRVLFAKNSDRDSNEAQLLEWHPAARHAEGSSLRCTWLEVPQARETHRVLLSRPFWMWGAEMGANEHGVVIGNEAVFTNQPVQERGLTGMDLLRLALERASTAEQAVAVITELLESFGQGGGCGHEDRSFTYHNSYIVADPTDAFVLETAGRRWEVERVCGTRTISNALTIEPFASRYGIASMAQVSGAERRRACTAARAESVGSAADMMALLRDHGAPGPSIPCEELNGGMNAPCMHAGGAVVNSQTTASWVAELAGGDARHWVTATAAPCTGLFKPVRLAEPLELGPAPGDRADETSLWWRHERLHRGVVRDPERLLPLFASERDAIEASWLSDPPDPASAFAEGDLQLARWESRVAAAGGEDQRPSWARDYWKVRNERAGLSV